MLFVGWLVQGRARGACAATLAVELEPRTVRVNILTAWAVRTDVGKALPTSEACIAENNNPTPARRLVTAEETAYGAQVLCSDAAAAMIGQTLVFDGGVGILA